MNSGETADELKLGGRGSDLRAGTLRRRIEKEDRQI